MCWAVRSNKIWQLFVYCRALKQGAITSAWSEMKSQFIFLFWKKLKFDLVNLNGLQRRLGLCYDRIAVKMTTTSFCWKNSIVHALAHLKVSVVQGNTVNAECENQQQICHQLVWHLTCVFHLFLQGRRQILFLAAISTGKIEYFSSSWNGLIRKQVIPSMCGPNDIFTVW